MWDHFVVQNSNSSSKSPKTELNGIAKSGSISPEAKFNAKSETAPLSNVPLFSKSTRSIVYGMQNRAVQVSCIECWDFDPEVFERCINLWIFYRVC